MWYLAEKKYLNQTGYGKLNCKSGYVEEFLRVKNLEDRSIKTQNKSKLL